MKSIDEDLKAGRLAAHEAKRIRDKITNAFKTGSNLRLLHEAEERQSYFKRNFMVDKNV